jgi:hypothetical protein
MAKGRIRRPMEREEKVMMLASGVAIQREGKGCVFTSSTARNGSRVKERCLQRLQCGSKRGVHLW